VSTPSEPSSGRAERARFLKLATRFTPLIAVPSGDATFVIKTRGGRFGRSFFIKGQRAEITNLKRAIYVLSELAAADVVTGKAFLDVGANIGTSTVTALRSHSFASAIAYELGARAVALRVAVSDAKGTGRLALSERDPGAHRMLPDRGGSKAKHGQEVVEVEQLTLDALVERGLVDPEQVGLLWLSVQGHEGHVLAGATTLLAVGAPIVARVEPALLEESGGRELVESCVSEYYDHAVDLSTVRLKTKSYESGLVDELTSLRPVAGDAERRPFSHLLLIRRRQGARRDRGHRGSAWSARRRRRARGTRAAPPRGEPG
jgi:FkbM family methyltransferase